jgi:hypothetical protein
MTLLAQSPFDGTWKTNFAESQLSQKPFVYSVNNGMYDCQSCSPKINVKTDGRDQPVTGQTYDTIAFQVVDANTVHLTAKKAGKTEFETTRTASQDGKVLTVATTIYPADGSQPYKAEGKNVNVDATGVTSTWKSVGDGLNFSTPAGVSWEAKLDGKEYPVKGTYANETVSLKQLGERSIEATFKRDGKIVSVDKITVSGDGKKMTTVADNKLTGRVSTLIDEKQ